MGWTRTAASQRERFTRAPRWIEGHTHWSAPGVRLWCRSTPTADSAEWESSWCDLRRLRAEVRIRDRTRASGVEIEAAEELAAVGTVGLVTCKKCRTRVRCVRGRYADWRARPVGSGGSGASACPCRKLCSVATPIEALPFRTPFLRPTPDRYLHRDRCYHRVLCGP